MKVKNSTRDHQHQHMRIPIPFSQQASQKNVCMYVSIYITENCYYEICEYECAKRKRLKELCESLLCSTEIVIKFTILWRLMIRMAEIVIFPLASSFHFISLPVDLHSVLQIE